MARKSASSSTAPGNGHAVESTATEDAQSRLDYTDRDSDASSPERTIKTRLPAFDPSLFPKGSRSLSLISIQAFSLGFCLAACSFLTAQLLWYGNPIWRLPAFFACLSLFHFLEFWTTAQFNAPNVKADSFLLFTNGAAYNIAHSLAATEVIISSFIPSYQRLYVNAFSIALGVSLVTTGQVVRSVAMAQAGTNFNHTPQQIRREGHDLVTRGVYSWLRHPSYFGFFWWALGTQFLVGNKICCLGYLIVLWRFFKKRITAEEKYLVAFFGVEYETYRRRTGTGIPFVR